MTCREPAELPVDSAAISAALRAALRRDKLAQRTTLTDDEHARRSAGIAAHLRQHLFSLAPARIGFCLPIKKEFDAAALVGELMARGWLAAVPVVESARQAMAFRHWWPQVPLERDRHGIPIPLSATCPPPEVLLVPLVAFDAAGFRLGYGGGYFDRTLAALSPRPWVIGVGFACAEAASVHPQAHDQPCDVLVTEEGWRPRATNAGEITA